MTANAISPNRGALLIAALILTSSASAQRPVRLVHGLGDAASIWAQGESNLNFTFGSQVQVAKPQLSGLASIGQQASHLSSFVPLSGNLAISIGHSAGGVVSRELDRTYGDLYGVITVGTPHTGAPVASNETQAVSSFTLYIAQLLLPVNIYWGYYGDHMAMAAAIDAVVLTSAATAYLSELRPAITSAAATDLRVGSGVLGTLNSPSNLSREATVMGNRRVSLLGWMPGASQFCAGSSWNFVDTCLFTMDAVGDGYYGLWQYYSNYFDPNDPWMFNKRENAFTWLPGAVQLWWQMNEGWCGITGNGDCNGDGFIPVANQAWPGAFNVLLPDQTPHRTEPNRLTVQNAIVAELRARFGLI